LILFLKDKGDEIIFCEHNSVTKQEQNKPSFIFIPVWKKASPSIIRIIKSRRIRWAGHVA
jgi:hypothetical protein